MIHVWCLFRCVYVFLHTIFVSNISVNIFLTPVSLTNSYHLLYLSLYKHFTLYCQKICLLDLDVNGCSILFNVLSKLYEYKSNNINNGIFVIYKGHLCTCKSFVYFISTFTIYSLHTIIDEVSFSLYLVSLCVFQVETQNRIFIRLHVYDFRILNYVDL